jgi:hypothetical protein
LLYLVFIGGVDKTIGFRDELSAREGDYLHQGKISKSEEIRRT